VNKRPLSISIIGYLFVTAGAVGFIYHLREIKGQLPADYDVFWVCFVRLIAVVGGVFLLRGRNWARWVLTIWLAFHLVLSVFHNLSGFIMHTLLLAVIAYFLLRAQASVYFRTAKAEVALVGKKEAK
jgi:hypothetical protein